VRPPRQSGYTPLRRRACPGFNGVMRRTLIMSTPLLAVLSACGSIRPAAQGSSPLPVPGGDPQPARPTLASESARMSALFQGTPVVFAMQGVNVLRVTVPRVNSFDPGSSKVKPALAAVLDRVARSQLQSGARFRVAAPADGDSRNSSLARERALSMRDYLLGQGIGVSRLQTASVAAPSDPVEIVVTAASIASPGANPA
jgi:hypothetical protein